MMTRKYMHTSEPNALEENLTIGCFMSDYMKEPISEWCCLMYYDECLHGHNYWGSVTTCNCPIKKPYISKGHFKVHHLCPAAEDRPIVIPRWKALEILNDWNAHQAQESVKSQRPVRWMYFLAEIKNDTGVKDNFNQIIVVDGKK